MNELEKILWIAFFEAKQFIRNIVFKIYCALQIFIFLFLTYILFFATEINLNSSAIPYVYVFVLNFIQTFSIIFIAANVFGHDRKHEATRALYSRPFSNIGYVLGKVSGVAFVFIFASLFFTLFAFLVHLFFFDAPIRYSYYFLYPLFIFLPTIIFTIGLTALITLLIRSEILTITILLCLFVFVSPGIASKFPYLWDFMGMNIPMFGSDFAGFGNIPLIILQRGVFIFAGIGLIFTSALFFRFYRHPQSPRISQASTGVVVVCFVISSLLGHEYFNIKYAGKELRTRMRALENSITNQSVLVLRSCSLDLVHKNDKIDVKAGISVENASKESAKIYHFRLNPGLEVLSVESNGKPLNFERNIHILTVNLSIPLKPGETDSLVIKYRGKIDENACYIDINESEHEKNNGKYPKLIIDKRYGFITRKYVLLTKENQWYPTPFVPLPKSIFNPLGRNFINFYLTVTTDKNLTAISQGKYLNNSPGKFTFTPENPLTQISLVIGDYKKISTNIDGIEYAFYSYNKHDNFEGFKEISQKKLNKLISEIKQDYENRICLEYPFKRFSMIETPIQFIAHQRDLLLSPETVQPEQILVPEKGIYYINFNGVCNINFKKGFEKLRKWSTYQDLTDEELRCKILRIFISYNFFEVYNNRIGLGLQKQIFGEIGKKTSIDFIYNFSPYPNYYCFASSFTSEKYPLFDIILSYYIKSKEEHRENYGITFGGFTASSVRQFRSSEIELIVRKLLTRYTLEQILEDPDYKYFLYYILKIKSETLFTILRTQSGISDNDLNNFIDSYLKSRRFKNIPAEDFLDSLKTDFGIDAAKYFESFQYNNKFANFEIYDAVRTTFLKDEHETYNYSFTVYNSGDTGGVIQASLGNNYHNELFWLDLSGNVNRWIYLEKNQAKEINMIADKFSEWNTRGIFVTYNAYNPRLMYIPFEYHDNVRENYIVPQEGEQIVAPPIRNASTDTLIIDDSEKGFEIISQPEQSYLRKYFKNSWIDDLGILAFSQENLPLQWQKRNGNIFYGQRDKTVCYKKSGKGDARVAWDVNLPSSGGYDIYYYTPSRENFKLMKSPVSTIYTVNDFHLLINDESGDKEVTLDFKDAKDGWTLLGNFMFSSNKAHVVLTDKSKGDLVYADAVKFVRK